MARLRNRIRKADRYSDGELLRWHRDKRSTYDGLYSLAEDSGCLEDDPFTWKLLIWPSPMDTDITVEKLAGWRDELIEAGKLIPYEAEGQRYLFIRSFHRHQHPRNPQNPTLPLPPWVRWIANQNDGRKGRYEVDGEAIPALYNAEMVTTSDPYNGSTTLVQRLYNDSPPRVPAPPRPAPPRSLRALAETDVPAGAQTSVLDDPDDAFEEWWAEYGRIGSKADAERLYRFWRGKGAERADLLTAARVYRDHCAATDCKMQHARTFLAKPAKGARARWYEWADGEAHGSMDVRDDTTLHDVLSAGAEAFGLKGGNGNGNGAGRLERGGPARAAVGGPDARRGVATRELEAGL